MPRAQEMTGRQLNRSLRNVFDLMDRRNTIILRENLEEP